MNSNFAVQPPGVAEPIMAAMPQALQVGSFGMTEAAGTVCTGAWDEPELQRITRLGRPLPGLEVRIINPETGGDMQTGLRGEVLVRGYSLFEGYFKDPEKTAQALDADGWFHTGDIGSLDEAGTVMFHGRLKDMLKVGGENVAAAEIEGLLGRHPSVKLAQVVGIPDAKYVEVPAAFVELMPGKTASERELIDFCRKEIASFKVPRVVRFVDEWPMSSSKIQKFRLRTALVDRTRPGLKAFEQPQEPLNDVSLWPRDAAWVRGSGHRTRHAALAAEDRARPVPHHRERAATPKPGIAACRADIDMAVALAQWGEVQVELIHQRNDAPSIYTEFPGRTLGGLQHVGVMTRDLAADLAKLRGRSISSRAVGRDGERHPLRLRRHRRATRRHDRVDRAWPGDRRLLLAGARRRTQLGRQRPHPAPVTMTARCKRGRLAPVQIAYHVPDPEAAAERYAREHGWGPFFLMEHIALERSLHRGTPAKFDHSSAYGQAGELMIELITQHDDTPVGAARHVRARTSRACTTSPASCPRCSRHSMTIAGRGIAHRARGAHHDGCRLSRWST